jgi:hypothetical protein
MEAQYSFVMYGDSCSGVPNATHAATLLKINALIEKKGDELDFVIFPGDEIIGLTNDETKLRNQWEYWLKEEMSYISKFNLPLYNCTGNHTTYNELSLKLFKEYLPNLPQNGPANLKGLSYFVQHPDLLLVFIDTMGNHIGGEGRVETEWLDKVLSNNDSKYKVVIGHHPIFPTNGFTGDFQRNVEVENGKQFWKVLKENNIFGYVCSHLLAYDVQVHEGVLQIMTAGAGTQYRMPPETEYHHYLDCILNNSGLTYNVIDEDGKTREQLKWPLSVNENKWTRVESPTKKHIQIEDWAPKPNPNILFLKLQFEIKAEAKNKKTLLCGWELENELPLIWIGLTGKENRLTVHLSREMGRSPMHWYGPEIDSNKAIEIELAFHRGLGPGGLLWKWKNSSEWNSLKSSTTMGVHQVQWPSNWFIQHDGDHDISGFTEPIKIQSQTEDLK